MEKLTPESKWILANKHKINGLKEGELIEENAATDRQDEETELRESCSEVSDAQDLGGDDAADADGGEPHDDADHLHDDLIHNSKKLDDSSSFFSKRSQHSSKCETEENNTECVGPIPGKQNMGVIVRCF